MSACACKIILGDCIGVNSPILGLSSFDDDHCYFYACCNSGGDAFAPPQLGGGIVTPSCEYNCFSGSTQAEADALAAEACGPQLPPPATIFYSNPQTAQVSCLAPDYLTDDQGNHITDDQGNKIVLGYSDIGWTATVTVQYGTSKSIINQADADAKALAIATQLANDQAAAHNCDQSTLVLVGAGGDPVAGVGGEPVEPVSW